MAEIKDSGNRTEFPSGAVRDIQEGKGRCNLLPLDVVAELFEDSDIRRIFNNIYTYTLDKNTEHLRTALFCFGRVSGWELPKMMLEVSKHFEMGAAKYGASNWQKGIPEERYVDSGVRHLLKYLDGWNDEPHDRAFCWNIMCLIWTHEHIGVAENEND